MGISVIDVGNYHKFFRSNIEVYGVTNVDEGYYDEKGKLRAKVHIVRANPSPAVISRHLNGEQSIGLLPIDETGKCHWGAIDIDDYARPLDAIVRAIYDFDMPLCPFWSKSKKLHLYTFLSTPCQPSELKDMLRRYFSLFDCFKTPDGRETEIFPKQKALEDVNTPSWINVPYYGNTRKMLNRDMEEIDLSAALMHIDTKRMSIEDHNAYLDHMPYNDAPPCIQSGCILRNVPRGGRNNFLFSVGVYFRLRDEGADLDDLLTKVNASLDDPIDDQRLKETILTGLKKKSYFYLCKELCGCNKEVCRKQKFGIESKETTGLDYGVLEQYKTDPPYYIWNVSGHKMVFFNETEMLHQNKFRELCHRYLHIVPRKISDDRWVKILNRANENVEVHEAEGEAGGFSNGSQFLQYTIEFFTARRAAEDKTQLNLGRTWYDEENNSYVFKASSYLSYIRNIKDFKVYSPIELQTKLQSIGAIQEGLLWRISKDKIPDPPEPQIDIDFHDKDDGGDF